MRKGIVNPTLHAIRSASYQSPRYSVTKPEGTYSDSVENMSGSGYNKNSKKLRELYDDARGIAIGARPNPEQNTKRFWGLYGQQANTAPYQSTKEMNNAMRLDIDKLRYGNTNRRISKSASVKKNTYYNTLGGGYDPNTVVTPKKGRPFKGQSDSLPLVSKRASSIKKDGTTPDYVNYRSPRKSKIEVQNPVDRWNEAYLNLFGAYDSQGKKIGENKVDAWRKKYGHNRYRMGTSIPGKKFGVLRPLTEEEGATLGYTLVDNFTNSEINKQPQSSLAYAYAPKKSIENKSPIARTLGPIAPIAFDPIFMGGITVPATIAAAEKYIPAYQKLPKTIKTPLRFAGKVIGAADAVNAAQASMYFSAANALENKYNYPTTMNYKQDTSVPTSARPNVVSEKFGQDANQMIGTQTATGLLGGALNNFLINPLKQKLWNTADLFGVGDAFRRPNVSPYLPFSTQNKLKNLNAYANSIVQNTKKIPADLNPFPETKRRPTYPAEFSELPLRTQQELARFGKPYETRIKPSRLRTALELPVQAYTGQMMDPTSFNSDYASDPSFLNRMSSMLDYYYGFQGSDKGTMQGPQTTVYGYAPEGVLRATRVQRPSRSAGQQQGKNMAPFTQIPGEIQPVNDWIEGTNEQAGMDLYTRWLNANNRNIQGEYVPNKKVFDSYSSKNQNFMDFLENAARTGMPETGTLNPGYYPSLNDQRFMYGVQLTPFNRITGEPNIENMSPYYVQESPEETTMQQLERIADMRQQNQFYKPLGKRMKKSISSNSHAKTKNSVAEIEAKSSSATLNAKKNTHSTTSLRHSNKYSK
jgi:hypothetical protein